MAIGVSRDSGSIEMKMTQDLAQRILSRGITPVIPESKKEEILMDWLKGDSYKTIQAMHSVSKSVVSAVVKKARNEAKEFINVEKGK